MSEGNEIDLADPAEREKRLVDLYARWQAAERNLADVRAKSKERTASARAHLRSAIEQGVGAADVQGQLSKLRTIEAAWQSLDEAKAEAVENRKQAVELLTIATKRLRDAVDSSQLSAMAT